MSYRSQAVGTTLLGTPLSFALCGLYAQFGPAEPATDMAVAVLLLVPVWTAVMIWGLKREQASATWIGLGAALAGVVAVILLSRWLIAG